MILDFYYQLELLNDSKKKVLVFYLIRDILVLKVNYEALCGRLPHIIFFLIGSNYQRLSQQLLDFRLNRSDYRP